MTPETPTPETEAFKRTVGTVWHDFAEKLERERDAARAENEAMREAIRVAHEALKELRSFYLDMTNLPPCAANAALAKLKPFLPDAQTPQP